jgi:hypothetical protein
MVNNPESWQHAKMEATQKNSWFIPEFVELAATNIARQFLQPEALQSLVSAYPVQQQGWHQGRLGLVMAGNIPLVGFHDFLCAFVAGIPMTIKASSKDEVLITHLVDKLKEMAPELDEQISFAPQLKHCTAYIATGSNNSGRYFEYYFRNHPHIIRRNRTSLAILTGQESQAELEALADDMLLYFGFGCRNVSKLLVPEGYDFQPLLQAMDKYQWMAENHKFKNNYDYNLALHLLNSKYYMTNGVLLLVEKEEIFSPISQVNYEYYKSQPSPEQLLQQYADDLQCVVSSAHIGFGNAQRPSISDFADGVDTMAFLTSL